MDWNVCDNWVRDRDLNGFHLASGKETVDVSGLSPGVYVVAVVDPVSGERVVRRVVKG